MPRAGRPKEKAMNDLTKELEQMTAQVAELRAALAEFAGAQLQANSARRQVVENPMTVGQLVEHAIATCKASSLRTYRSGWMALITGFGKEAEPGHVKRLRDVMFTRSRPSNSKLS
jgi:hypothetical protein